MLLSFSDLSLSLRWWGYLFVIGLIFFPFVRRIFPNFIDKGYPFAKILGGVIISYIVFVLGAAHIAPFTQVTIYAVSFLSAIGITLLLIKSPKKRDFSLSSLLLVIFEEIIFLGGIVLWATVRGHQPDIFGLEKYMDFGFVNSILRSTYFPPRDMWYTPLPINYYYFGHLITAVLTKLSNISPFISYNLMIATLFSFTFTLSFSLVGNVWSKFIFLRQALHQNSTGQAQIESTRGKNQIFQFVFSGLLGGFLVALGGNLHTIYTFFTAYSNDNPVPFWQLVFSPKTFPNSYWYPNATRFIYHTIHEFPSYSFVVSDLHGHVLDIPMVLTTIAILFATITNSQFTRYKKIVTTKFQKPKSFGYLKFEKLKLICELFLVNWNLVLIGFLLAVMYMTNAWDGMIYFLLSSVMLFLQTKNVLRTINYILTILASFLIFSLPFSLFFNPGALVGGIGLICSPPFLISIGKIGPFIFEPNHCMHSPLWQLLILYGFFLFWFISFIFILLKQKKALTAPDIFITMLSGMAIFLIIVPEFFYLRDIYTTYFRANTMFKLVYQAFILFSLSVTYMMFRFIHFFAEKNLSFWRKLFLFPYFLIGLVFFSLVSIYSYFAIASYYGNATAYKGLNGITYLSKSYPTDANAIFWIQSHITGQPVILEAQGDSYTEYARISANTGLPTILGWPVHEWLWRGTYDIVPPRSSDIQTMYETKDETVFTTLAKKYNIRLVFVGQLERTKYPNLYENKFALLGKPIFHEGITTIYQVSFSQ